MAAMAIVEQYQHGLTISSSGMTGLNFLGFQAYMDGQLCKI